MSGVGGTRHDLVPPPPAGFGFAVTIDPPVPLIDGAGPFAASPGALLDWATEAAEGARCVYARCENIAVTAPRLKAKAGELAAAGVIVFGGIQRHAADSSLFDYVARRTCAGANMTAPPPALRPEESAAEREIMDKIFEAIRRAARAGQRCPSDHALALAAELPTRNAAAWRVRKLARDGRIGIETMPGPDGPWRVVAVEGKRTAEPPLRRRA